eukprot:Gb_31249 [translate_table: standard]
MLMHAPGGAEGEDAPEGKEPLQGIDAREPLQIAHWRWKKPLKPLKLNYKSGHSDEFGKRLETKAPLCCQSVERWRDKGLDSCWELEVFPAKGVFERQFERQCIEDSWQRTGAVRSSVHPGVAPHSKGYEDLDIESLIERPKPFPEHEVEQEDRVTGVRWEEAPPLRSLCGREGEVAMVDSAREPIKLGATQVCHSRRLRPNRPPREAIGSGISHRPSASLSCISGIRAWVQSRDQLSEQWNELSEPKEQLVRTVGTKHREFRAQWQSRVTVGMESPECRSAAAVIGVSKVEFGGSQS